MATVINAQTSAGGLSITPDLSGQIALQASGNTIATISSTGVNLSAAGLVFNDSTTQTSGSGAAKAWVCFNGNNGATRASYNVSSVTRNTTGEYTINFANALVDTNYSFMGVAGYDSGNQQAWVSSPSGTARTSWKQTTSLYIWTVYANNSAASVDPSDVCVSIFR